MRKGTLGSSVVSVFMSLVLVVGLMPLPAYAQGAPAQSSPAQGGLQAGVVAGMGEQDGGIAEGTAAIELESENGTIPEVSLGGASVQEGDLAAQDVSTQAVSDPIDEKHSAMGLFKYIRDNSTAGSPQYVDAQCAIDVLEGTTTAGMSYPTYQGPAQSTSNTTATNGASNATAYQRVNYTQGDAVSLTNFETSLSWIDSYNQYRANENSTEGTSLATNIGMNCRMMAISIVQCDWSKATIAHSRAFDVGENLSWGYANPFDGWYTEEKAIYKGYLAAGKTTLTDEEQSKVGHYFNIVDYAGTSYYGYYSALVTGFATCTDDAQYRVCHEQSFYTYSYYPPNVSYSTNDFRTTWLEPYKASIADSQPVNIAGATVALAANSFTYDGQPHKPAVSSVTLAGGTVVPADSYDVTYAPADCTAAGDYTVTVTGKGNYTGQASKTFTISPASLVGATVSVSPTSYTYDGSAKDPAPTVTLGGKTLVPNTDYTVSYSDNTAVGTATVTVEGKGNYTGQASTTFTITEPAPIDDAAYAILYSNGELVFQRGSVEQAGRAVVGSWTGFENNTVHDGQLKWWQIENTGNVSSITFKDTIKPLSTSSWFAGMPNLTSVNGINKLDTSSTTRMDSMFSYCTSLASLDLSPLNVSSVTMLDSMFANCSGLTSLTLPSSYTSAAKSLDRMFENCYALSALDLSYIDTTHVESMTKMLRSCSNMKSLTLGDRFNFVIVANSYGDDYAEIPNHPSTEVYTTNWKRTSDGLSLSSDELSRRTADAAGTWVWETVEEQPTPDPTPGPSPTPTPTPTPTPGPSPSGASRVMHRLYNHWSGEHFYTASDSEKNGLVALGWTYEGVGWNAPTSGTDVHRLYNRWTGDHHFTTSVAERDQCVAAGWTYEGVGWKSGGSKPVYREYNPYAPAFYHNYTASAAEHAGLIAVGWHDEGTGWYGV